MSLIEGRKAKENIHEEKTIDASLSYWKDEEFNKYSALARSLLHFDVSRRIFDDRLAFLKIFMSRLDVEINGEI